MTHLPPRPPKPAKPVAVNKDTPLPDVPAVELRFDGACAPNPGPMGIGYLLITGGQQTASGGGPRVLVRVGAQIGQGTNNEAEYQALISGLRHALRLGMLSLVIRTDSLLVANQVTGRWKAKDKRLARLLLEVEALLGLFNFTNIIHTYREDNTEADALSHQLVFEEPEQPPLPPPKHGTTPRQLHDYQAALVRVWFLSGRTRNVHLLARIFGVRVQVIEQIVEGKTYRHATFQNHPQYTPTPESQAVTTPQLECSICPGNGWVSPT